MIVKEADQLIVDGAGHRGLGGGHVPGPYRVHLGEATLIRNVWVDSPSRKTRTHCSLVSAGCGVRASTGNWHRCRLSTAATTTFVASASAAHTQPFSREAQELV